MYTNVSNGLAALMADSNGLSYIAQIREKIRDNWTIRTCVVRSMKISMGGNGSNYITMGTAYCATAELTLYGADFEMRDHEFEIRIGMNVNGTPEYVPMGLFTAEKPVLDGENTKVTLYDRMKSFEKAYFSSLIYPQNVRNVVAEICNQCGVPYASFSSSIPITVKPEGYTCREMISYIAQLLGCFAVINRNGELEFRWYSNTITMTLSVSQYWDPFDRSENNYTVHRIAAVIGKEEQDGQSRDKVVSAPSGSGGTKGIVFQNPFYTQTIVNSVWNARGGYVYRPGNLKALGDPRVDSGDVLSIEGMDGNTYMVPVMTIDYEYDGGLSMKIGAVGEEEQKDDFSVKGPNTQAIERMSSRLILAEKILANKIDADEVISHYIKTDELDAAVINSNVIKSNFAAIDLTNVNWADVGTLISGHAIIDSANIKDGVITSAKINSETVLDSFIKSIDAGKITTGTLDCGNLTVVSLNAGSITVGKINGTQIDSGSISRAHLGSAVINDIDGKNSVHYSATAPASTGQDGDLWFNTAEDNAIYILTVAVNPVTGEETSRSWVKKELGDGAFANLSASKITSGSIDAGRVQVINLNASNISSGTLDASLVNVTNLNASNINTGTISGNLIANNTITKDMLAGNITADKLSVNDLQAIAAKIGAINITTTNLHSGSHDSYNSENAGFCLDKDGNFGVGNGNFHMWWNGSSLDIKGQLFATSGRIGGFITDSCRMYYMGGDEGRVVIDDNDFWYANEDLILQKRVPKNQEQCIDGTFIDVYDNVYRLDIVAQKDRGGVESSTSAFWIRKGSAPGIWKNIFSIQYDGTICNYEYSLDKVTYNTWYEYRRACLKPEGLTIRETTDWNSSGAGTSFDVSLLDSEELIFSGPSGRKGKLLSDTNRIGLYGLEEVHLGTLGTGTNVTDSIIINRSGINIKNSISFDSNLTIGSSIKIIFGGSNSSWIGRDGSTGYIQLGQLGSMVTSGNYLVLDGSDRLRYMSGSSKRFKNFIGEAQDSEAKKLLGLPVVDFVYKSGYLDSSDEKYGKVLTGLFAEDVERLFPDAVYHRDGLVENYIDRQLLVRLIKLVQIQQREIDELKKGVA